MFVATERDTIGLIGAQVVGDTIFGIDPADNGRRIAIPVADARSISMTRFNRTDTVYLVLGMLPILVPVIFFAVFSPST